MSIIYGDCVEAMAGMEECSVDAIATDPPYMIGFMGKAFDSAATEPQQMQEWHHRWAVEALRVLRPGAFIASMGGTRTVHRLMCALEDAGFEIRDTIGWHYLSGFPKNHDIGKAIDKVGGAQRKAVGHYQHPDGKHRDPAKHKAHNETARVHNWGLSRRHFELEVTAPGSDDAKRWHGWGTALKPSWEPIVLARKPLSESSVARNVLEHECGGINVDGCRVPSNDEAWARRPPRDTEGGPHRLGASDYRVREVYQEGSPEGRWPANTLRTEPFGDGRDKYFLSPCFDPEVAKVDDALLEANGFFFVPKASRGERELGCEGLEEKRAGCMDGNAGHSGSRLSIAGNPVQPMRRNTHPTCKPIALFRHLVRLLTPPGGTVLDPFLGSGTTGIAAILEGFEWIGIEQDEHYCLIAWTRTKAWEEKRILEDKA